MKLHNNKRGQEEMIGFGLIIVIVAVILLVFFAISLGKSKNSNLDSYEVSSFIQSALQHTTDCTENGEPLSVQKLIFECSEGALCEDGRESCSVLNSTLNGVSDAGWSVGQNNPTIGYELVVMSGEEKLVYLLEGNKTTSYKGASQNFSNNRGLIAFYFTAYS